MTNPKINIIEEADSSIEAWEYYNKIYTEEHWGLIKEFDIDNIEFNVHVRYYARLKKDSKLNSGFKEISSSKSSSFNFSLAGDCDFNFNEKKKKLFSELLKDCDKNVDRNEVEGLLEYCCNMHHNKINFSLMPRTGALNNFKGCMKHKSEKHSYDRLDVFIYHLNNFFSEGNEDIFKRSTETNKKYIEFYLKNNFEDIYDYCNKIYFIDNRKFIKKLIENGKKAITNANDLIEYMNLAKEYWKIKKEKIDTILCNK